MVDFVSLFVTAFPLRPFLLQKPTLLYNIVFISIWFTFVFADVFVRFASVGGADVKSMRWKIMVKKTPILRNTLILF